MRKTVFILSVILLSFSGCPGKKEDGTATLKSIGSRLMALLPSDRGETYGMSVCSSWLIVMLQMDRQMEQMGGETKSLYRFGPNDLKIRKAYAKITQDYVDTGKITKSNDFGMKVFPSFIKECTKTRRLEYDKCYPQAGADDQKFSACSQPFVERFKLGLMWFSARSMRKHGFTDMGEYLDDVMQKDMRAAEVDPMGFLAH